MRAARPTEIRDGSVDAGLICLSAIARPGRPFTQAEIAYACGRTRGWCFMAEQKILKKIRERLRRSLEFSYRDFNQGGNV